MCAAIALAIWTDFANQTLRQYAQQRRTQKERLNAHVGQSCDGTGGIVGVQRGQNQMTGHGGLNGNLCGFKIANLTNHDDVRVLPEDGSQGFGKGQIYLGIDLCLAYA